MKIIIKDFLLNLRGLDSTILRDENNCYTFLPVPDEVSGGVNIFFDNLL